MCGWSTKAVRRLMSNPKGCKRKPCFICGDHEGITELHHVVYVSELTSLLNKGVIGLEDVQTPVVWLCPNCHAYVHASMRGETDMVASLMVRDREWREGYEELARIRNDYIKKHIIDKVVA